MTETPAWAVTAICGDCLTSDTGRAILSGAVGIATTSAGPAERCILCGYPFADTVSNERPGGHRPDTAGTP